MLAKDLVDGLSKLLNEIEVDGYQPVMEVQLGMFNTVLKAVNMQLKYEKYKSKHGIYVEYFEESGSIDTKEGSKIKKAKKLKNKVKRKLKAKKTGN